MKVLTRLLILTLVAVTVASSIYYTYDIQQKTGMGDARSRIAGARQMSDGKSPYFYNWFPGDTLRYYNGSIVDAPRLADTIPANLTASPVFMRLLQPFANHNQYLFDWAFYFIFHAFFFIAFYLALRSAPTNYKWVPLLLFLPFLWTDGWIYHFYVVQHYMLYGFLLAIIVWLLQQQKAIAAGFIFAFLILLRLNIVVCLVPFVLIWHPLSKKFILAIISGLVVYLVIVGLNPLEQKLWVDYFAALKIHQSLHMQTNIDTHNVVSQIHTIPLLPRPFEGVDYMQLDSLWTAKNFTINKEATNAKEAVEAIWGRYPPVWVLQLLYIISTGIIILWAWWQKKQTKIYPLYKTIIMGLLFYFLTNFFSSVYIAPYHLPQWYAVALVYCIYANKIPNLIMYLFGFGLILNLHFFPNFAGRHLLAEMLLLASAALTVVLPEREKV